MKLATCSLLSAFQINANLPVYRQMALKRPWRILNIRRWAFLFFLLFCGQWRARSSIGKKQRKKNYPSVKIRGICGKLFRVFRHFRGLFSFLLRVLRASPWEYFLFANKKYFAISNYLTPSLTPSKICHLFFCHSCCCKSLGNIFYHRCALHSLGKITEAFPL